MKFVVRLLVTVLCLIQIGGLLPSTARAEDQIDITQTPEPTVAVTEPDPPVIPTETPLVLPTETSLPTKTPPPPTFEPTATTEPTATNEPIATNEPTATLTPTPSPSPTIDATATPTLSPSPTIDATSIESDDFAAAAIESLTTDPSGTMPVGTSVVAQANGLTYQPTELGTMTYAWFDGSTCDGPANLAGGGAVTADTVNEELIIPPSDSITMTSTGTRSFSATYSGDPVNSIQTICTAIDVESRTPVIAVIPPLSPVTAGESRSSEATLTGSYLASGTLTYEIYSNATCTGTPSTTATVPIEIPDTMPSSGDMPIDRTGALTDSLYWQVSYSGDANNELAESSCTVQIVDKQPTTLDLTLDPVTITTGTSTVGTATLDDSVLAASGDLTYTAFQDTTCTTAFNPPIEDPKTVTDGIAAPSEPISIPIVGNHSIQVVYAGDDNNATAESPCVAIAVTISVPTLAITIDPPTVDQNQTAFGTSVLTEASSNATGTVTYRVYSDDACATEIDGQSSTADVADGLVGETTEPESITFATSGQFYWQASYSGDIQNGPAISTCASFVVRTIPTLSAAFAPDAITIGESSAGTAQLAGATTDAGGTVTFATWSDDTCTTPLPTSIDGDVPVTNGIFPDSTSETFGTSGTVYLTATYSGDIFNAPATSGCAALDVTAASSILTMVQIPDPVAIGGGFSVAFALTDTIATPTGTVTLQLSSLADCLTPIDGQIYTLELAGGLVPDSPEIIYDFAGTAYAQSTYSGDANNLPSSTVCQPINLITGALTASIDSVTLDPVAYSNDPQTNSGQLVLTVSDPRGTAEGWSISIIVGDFAYSGPSTSQPDLPAGSLTLTGTELPTTITGQPVGIGGPNATDVSGSLATSQTVIASEPGSGSGTYTQTLNIELEIPESSSAGTYTGTITVTTSAAP